MKNGTHYTKRLKKHFSKLLAPPPAAAPGDPLDTLAASILGRDCGYSAGRRSLEHLLATFVDYNEARVCSPEDLAVMIGSRLPRAEERCGQLRLALNDIFERENRMSLERVRSMKLRDARQFLATISGVDEYSVASVVLRSLGGHAIPVDDAAWTLLKSKDLVDPQATRGEVQGFLERAVSAADAHAFCHTLESAAGAGEKVGAARKATSRGKAVSTASATSSATGRRGAATTPRKKPARTSRKTAGATKATKTTRRKSRSS